jgi:2-isopropylmalate synthase
MSHVEIFDTTLRDGSQGEGVSFSMADKVKVLKSLDEFRIDYVEGGWPGSNPKDIEFFKAARDLPLVHARLVAFGSTCRPNVAPGDDANLEALIGVETPAVAIFGKSWKLHVKEVFRTTLEENLRMIEESVRFLESHGREVIYDAEHFFDGYKDDPEYALETLGAARRGGASCLVLCDTNGGTLPDELGRIVRAVCERMAGSKIGIHTHNDSGVAVANSLVAVESGAKHVQGTFNGFGERCGNADLTAIIPNLLLKMNRRLSIDADTIRDLSRTARTICAIANRTFPENHPFVGQMAFAHKGGVHVNSVRKVSDSYEHVRPEVVGNHRRILISELSGKSNFEHLAELEDVDLSRDKDAARHAVAEIKELENRGYVFEGAAASATLVLLRHLGRLPELFELVRYRSSVEHRRTGGTSSEATVKIRVQGVERLAVGEGVGPVDALDEALRNALRPFHPEVSDIHLRDYRVRIINAEAGTDARVCVTIESASNDGELSWTTVGAHENLIEASWFALEDSIRYGLYRLRREKDAPVA